MITFVGHDDTYLLLALIPNLLRQHLISYHSCSVLSAYERERERGIVCLSSVLGLDKVHYAHVTS